MSLRVLFYTVQSNFMSLRVLFYIESQILCHRRILSYIFYILSHINIVQPNSMSLKNSILHHTVKFYVSRNSILQRTVKFYFTQYSQILYQLIPFVCVFKDKEMGNTCQRPSRQTSSR